MHDDGDRRIVPIARALPGWLRFPRQRRRDQFSLSFEGLRSGDSGARGRPDSDAPPCASSVRQRASPCPASHARPSEQHARTIGNGKPDRRNRKGYPGLFASKRVFYGVKKPEPASPGTLPRRRRSDRDRRVFRGNRRRRQPRRTVRLR